MENKVGLCKPPNLKHTAGILIISIYTFCKDCDMALEAREAISLNEINQFRLGGKELRSIKIEKLYEKLSQLINVGSE